MNLSYFLHALDYLVGVFFREVSVIHEKSLKLFVEAHVCRLLPQNHVVQWACRIRMFTKVHGYQRWWRPRNDLIGGHDRPTRSSRRYAPNLPVL